MSNDINAVAVISYVISIGPNAGVKGTIELPIRDLASAISQAREILVRGELEDGNITADQAASSGIVFDIAFITSATWGVPTNWIGGPR
jgi:hypothetical protein